MDSPYRSNRNEREIAMRGPDRDLTNADIAENFRGAAKQHPRTKAAAMFNVLAELHDQAEAENPGEVVVQATVKDCPDCTKDGVIIRQECDTCGETRWIEIRDEVEAEKCFRCGRTIVLVPSGGHYKWVDNAAKANSWHCGNDPRYPLQSHRPARFGEAM
jgi:ssDNA-binding Zn-finger/Zn-ribbon topoisomerase 1